MNPYSKLPRSRYWRTASAAWVKGAYGEVFKPRFAIDRKTKIGTAGSCFAQHIGRTLRERGYNFVDAEPAPRWLTADEQTALGYGLYSARYGNIYTSRQLLQLIQAAFGSYAIDEVWEDKGRFYDPVRPTVEQGGFSSAEEVRAMRASHHEAVRGLLENCGVFVFTMGLTEVWLNKTTKLAYPTCPGTVVGEFDPEQHVFKNLGFADVFADLDRSFRWLKKVNPKIKIMLTVSPVPLAATASADNVVVATSYSKAVLRAVAGALAATHDYIDYFPSYELVTSHLSGGRSFESDMRNVRPETVERVMSCFLASHGDEGMAPPPLAPPPSDDAAADAEMIAKVHLVCEEQALDQSAL